MALEDAICKSVMDRILNFGFCQTTLLSSRNFVRYLDDRDIDVGAEELEYLESVGLLQPIARLNRPLEPEGSRQKYSGVILSTWAFREYLRQGALQYPVSGDFKGWTEYRDGYEEGTLFLYHRFQLSEIHRLLATLHVKIPASSFGAKVDLQKMAAFRDAFFASYRKARASVLRLTFLLIELETPYLPQVTGSFHENILDNDSLKKWKEWRSNEFSSKAILDAFGLSVPDVRNLRDTLAVWGHSVDPLSHWYPLVMMASRQARRDLRGKALLAQDFYEMVHLLNAFLEDLTGESQAEPDDITDLRHGSWKGKWFGAPFSYSNPRVQQRIVQHYIGVSLPTATIAFEGDSEEQAILALSDAVGFDLKSEGVELFNCEGQGGFNQSTFYETLRTWRAENIRAFLIMDGDLESGKLARKFIELGLIKNGNCRVWDSDFEEDNFGIQAVCQTLNTLLTARGSPSLSEAEVKSDRMQSQGVLMKSIASVYKRVHGGAKIFDIVSKVELVKQLLSPRLAEISSEIESDSYSPRLPIEKFLAHVFRELRTPEDDSERNVQD